MFYMVNFVKLFCNNFKEIFVEIIDLLNAKHLRCAHAYENILSYTYYIKDSRIFKISRILML